MNNTDKWKEELREKLKFIPVPVIYSDERARMNLFDSSDIMTETIRQVFYMFTAKSKDWSYEHEWRIIQDEKSCSNDWDSENYGAALNMIMPKSIILGNRISDNDSDVLRDYSQKEKIDLYKMELDPHLYKLNIREVGIF